MSKMEVFSKIVNGWKLLIIFAKSSFLDDWQGFEYASEPLIDFADLVFWDVLRILVPFLQFKKKREKHPRRE